MSSASNPPILELRDAAFSYSRLTSFVEHLSFAVGEAEFIGLLGANGSGKSTILKLCCGILRPLSGEVSLWGNPLRTYKNRDRAKLISYLPQSLDFSVPFTVRELVGMGLYPYDIPPAMSAHEALDMVGLLGKSDSYLSDLSGGEKRRTFIAMTLLQGAGLILLDEPLANLDIRYQIELVRLLKKLRETRDISIVMALHDINIALHFEKVMLVKDGGLVGMGSPRNVLTEEAIAGAFDVPVKIMRGPDGRSYLTYEDYANDGR
jgi:ABC-type cobalamin/Fe3+-siderophores transport system ATPase subunit